MKWINTEWNEKHHHILYFLIGFIIVLFSLNYVLAQHYRPIDFLKNYFDIKKAVVIEQKIQNLPIEPPKKEQKKIPIFVYHSVRPYVFGESQLQDTYDITPELFEKELIYLRDNGYKVISPDEIFVDTTNGKIVTFAEKPVMLTFDDGWSNQYEYAYPLLSKYNMKGVFYIYTQPIGAPAFLTWNQIIEMQQSGMIIGSHSLTHPFLKKVDDDQLRHEIIDSKTTLEEKLGTPIKDFAAPYGYSDDRIVSIIKEAGYRTARTLYKSSYHNDLFNLRGYLASDNFSDFVRDIGRENK